MIHDQQEKEPTRKNEPLIARIRKTPFYYIIEFLVIINIALALINTGLWFMAGQQKRFITADFTSYYTGFKMVLNGDGSNLYDLDLQAKYQQEIMGNIQFVGGGAALCKPAVHCGFVFTPCVVTDWHGILSLDDW